MKKIQQFLLLSILFVFIVAFVNATHKNNEELPLIVQEDYSLTDTSLKKVVKTSTEWKKALTANQYYILREKGTERPFQNAYHDNKKTGHYYCAGCKLPLFSSKNKFDSGTGWPSFYAPLEKNRVLEIIDKTHGMVRGEIVCARCGGHLGHVFDDGPQPTGLRYCMNSGAMVFVESKK